PAISPSIELSVAEGAATIWVPNLLSPLGPDASFRPPLVVLIVGTLIPISAMALAAADLLRRYRHGSTTEQLQIRWLLASIAFVVLAVLYGLSVWVIGGPEFGWVAWLPALFAYPTLGISIAVAVLRYRLYEIDR